jgi:hypothetical protein
MDGAIEKALKLWTPRKGEHPWESVEAEAEARAPEDCAGFKSGEEAGEGALEAGSGSVVDQKAAADNNSSIAEHPVQAVETEEAVKHAVPGNGTSGAQHTLETGQERAADTEQASALPSTQNRVDLHPKKRSALGRMARGFKAALSSGRSKCGSERSSQADELIAATIADHSVEPQPAAVNDIANGTSNQTLVGGHLHGHGERGREQAVEAALLRSDTAEGGQGAHTGTGEPLAKQGFFQQQLTRFGRQRGQSEGTSTLFQQKNAGLATRKDSSPNRSGSLNATSVMVESSKGAAAASRAESSAQPRSAGHQSAAKGAELAAAAWKSLVRGRRVRSAGDELAVATQPPLRQQQQQLLGKQQHAPEWNGTAKLDRCAAVDEVQP